ncbi:hypothetical protein DPEC_G00055380 [Dallia pectoralis]|uniref:Uncharacterized protein n=1 Tax=Dallia pectoralis TaxID=75939 RepID=A0ACC2H5C0_DALPE|nr:hypothetical protein DPEC_G00055380 [Dallia pectoralis]
MELCPRWLEEGHGGVIQLSQVRSADQRVQITMCAHGIPLKSTVESSSHVTVGAQRLVHRSLQGPAPGGPTASEPRAQGPSTGERERPPFQTMLHSAPGALQSSAQATQHGEVQPC